MMIRVRRAGIGTALAAVTAMVLAACGSGPAPAAPAAAPSAAPAAAPGTFAADVGPGVFPRTVTHDRGTTTIPARPQRVVVLDTGELDAVLSLGVTPVGYARPDGLPLPYLAQRVDGVPDVGQVYELKLEAVAALKPDLILGSTTRAEKFYPQLSSIAPTVFSATPGYAWKDNFRLAALALGAEDEADRVMGEYQRRADALKARAGATPPQISLVRFLPGEIRLYGNQTFPGTLLADVGLRRPPVQDVDEFSVDISREQVGQAGGDVILYTSYGPAETTDLPSVVNGPAWTLLPAVAAKKAYPVADDVWFLGLGPLGANRVLDDMERLRLTG